MLLSSGIILLILFENLSTAMLIALTVLLMMFVGRVPLKQLGRLVGFIALLGVLALSLVMLVGDDKKLEDDLCGFTLYHPSLQNGYHRQQM